MRPSFPSSIFHFPFVTCHCCLAVCCSKVLTALFVSSHLVTNDKWKMPSDKWKMKGLLLHCRDTVLPARALLGPQFHAVQLDSQVHYLSWVRDRIQLHLNRKGLVG